MPRVTLDCSNNLDHSSILEILTDNGVCQCARCDDLELEENANNVRISEYGGRNSDSETWCESCADTYAYCCDCCGDTVSEDVTERDSDLSVCRGCYENYYFYCEGCNGLFHNDNMGHCEDGCYCEGCTPESDDDDDDDETGIENIESLGNYTGSGIGGYHGDSIRSAWYVPDGAVSVEIEIKTKHRNRVANFLRSAFKCACERDGSLDDSQGMEIITKPETYPKILKTLEDLLNSVKTMKVAKAWDCGKGYGIHVNLDARQWGETKQKAYCAQFGASNRAWLELVAGRDETSYAKYKTDDGETIETGKYSASGMKSGGRMEIRIFRSTLKSETALGYVALCKDIERYIDSDLFRRPKDLLFWLVRHGSKETRYLLGTKLTGQALMALLPPNTFESWLVDAGIEIGTN